ncbi:hypothetical protein VULLAG_LOCUS3080 [Vulpes lagopus]
MRIDLSSIIPNPSWTVSSARTEDLCVVGHNSTCNSSLHMGLPQHPLWDSVW